MATQNTEALSTLKGMFPDVDPEVCEAVFEANQANLEQSINALLSMSDPNYKSEETIPVQTESGYNSREQIRRDEELARSLAAEADRQFYAENPQYDAQQQRQRQQSPPQQQQSAFPDFSEELPIIKEKVVQAFDTTKKKAKEWYDKIKQQTATRNETTQHSTPHYTSLPGYEADNPLLEEDFSPLQPRKNNDRQYINTTNNTSNTTPNSRISPLKSQPVYGSHGIDVNKDTDDDVFSSSTNNHQIKIIREEHNQSPINTTSKASPYKLNDDFEIPVNNNNNNSTSTTTSSTSPERYDSQKATSADAEEIKKI
ncbi:hypothetical protein RclHR1_08620013 [Rhizophagus clarus]|uniref:CUE domain-containing protein n=1 Tax=Rhizophagus clarus TaxID=94130 RepID=A0A2Z6SNM0_9GLOM|nr:hypothetical protein RclHR1_08620013 [Rhizophagus clarus]